MKKSNIILLITIPTIVIALFILILALPKITGYNFFITQDGKTILTSNDIDRACESRVCSRGSFGKPDIFTRTTRKKSTSYFSWEIPFPAENVQNINFESPVKIHKGLKTFESDIYIEHYVLYDEELERRYPQMSDEQKENIQKTAFIIVRFELESRSKTFVEFKTQRLIEYLKKVCHYKDY